MSLQVEEQASLLRYNTFGLPASAQCLVHVHDDDEVRAALRLALLRELPLLVLGGGSNLLLTQDQQALVMHMQSCGRHIVDDDGEHCLVEAQAGENWHDFVQWTLQQGLVGLENLSLIPGTVGAAPMQNIGAYGVELADHFVSLDALHVATGELHQFDLGACRFAYRDSLFKQQAGQWVILRVRMRLARHAPLRLDYGPLRGCLQVMGIEQPNAQDVADAVCAIRREKLPDPRELGNAGSFFKNPLVSLTLAERIRQQHADLVAYPAGVGQVKLAAGWLIERAGWKGYREGRVGVHEQQALVLVNHGGASGSEVLALAEKIRADIRQRFAVELEIEPNVR